MDMKTWSVVIGAAAFFCLASPGMADPRDSVDRGDRLDRDAIQDDIRIDRLKIPRHPLSAEQPLTQQEPVAAPRAKQKESKKNSKKDGDVH
jgi:hypothetical protein